MLDLHGVRRRAPIAGLIVAFLLLAPFFPHYYLHILNLAIISAIFALSLDLLMGHVGLPSLGHAACFGTAAYAVAILIVRYHLGWTAAALIALAFSTVVAASFGLIAVRTVDVFFMMITLALSQILWGVANRWGSLTGGYNGIPGVPRPLPALESDLASFYVLAGLLGGSIWLVFRIAGSPFGLTLRGIRDRELRMSVLGYDVWMHKFATFVLCGALAGLAGVMNTFYNGFVSPADLSIRTSAEAVLMVVMGGTGTLIGPVIGAGIIVGLRNILSTYFERWQTLLGAIFMLTVIFAPNGIIGLWNRRLSGSREQAPDEAASRDEVVNAGEWDPAALIVVEEIPKPDSRERAGSIALELRAVSKAFGGVRAVSDVSFSIGRGERVALLGPNGAGKTTLFNLISGTLPVSSGSILLFAADVTRMAPHKRAAAGLGRTFQISTLFPTLTVLDNVRIALMGLGRVKYATMREMTGLRDLGDSARLLLERLDLWSRRSVAVRELSHGEQRILEIVLAVANRPHVLLLDEPTSGVAAAEAAWIVRVIRSLDPQIAVLIIEHDMDVAFALATRILVLHHGSVVAAGTQREIQADPLVQRVYLGTE